MQNTVAYKTAARAHLGSRECPAHLRLDGTERDFSYVRRVEPNGQDKAQEGER